MSADRSTEESWLQKLEQAADESGDFTGRARTFRQILAAAWADGRDRGYSDHRDDLFRADYAKRQAAREAAATDKEIK